MNRAERRAAARQRQRGAARFELVLAHCEDCGAPACPVCDTHSTECPCCGGFYCETCGYWLGVPCTPFIDLSLN